MRKILRIFLGTIAIATGGTLAYLAYALAADHAVKYPIYVISISLIILGFTAVFSSKKLNEVFLLSLLLS